MERKHMERKRSKLFAGILLGSVAGMAVAMLDQTTRKNVVRNVKHCTKRSIAWLRDVCENPQAFYNNVKHNVNEVSRTAKEVADDIQLVFSKLKEVKETSSRALDTAREAGEEMKEIGKKMIHMEGEVLNSTDDEEKSRNSNLELH